MNKVQKLEAQVASLAAELCKLRTSRVDKLWKLKVIESTEPNYKGSREFYSNNNEVQESCNRLLAGDIYMFHTGEVVTARTMENYIILDGEGMYTAYDTIGAMKHLQDVIVPSLPEELAIKLRADGFGRNSTADDFAYALAKSPEFSKRIEYSYKLKLELFEIKMSDNNELARYNVPIMAVDNEIVLTK